VIHIYASFSEHFLKFTIADAIFTIPTNSPKNDFTLKVPTVEGIHLLYLEINKIFSLSCQPICNSAPKIGCTPETLRVWYQKYLDQQDPVKAQQLSHQERIKQLERENKELQRANEILRKAAAFFAQAELDRPHKQWWILSITIRRYMVLRRFVEFYRWHLQPITGL